MVNYSAFHWSEKARKYAETIGTIFNVKGRVNTVADLPSTGNKVGDLYLVGLSTDADLIEYAWLSFDNVTRWEKLGSTAISTSFSALTGSPYDNTALGNALGDKYDASNPAGYTSNVGTVTSVNNVHPENGNVTITFPDPLPSQTGQSGKFLTTDGTDASWGNIPSDSTKANTSLDNINASSTAKQTIVGWVIPDYTTAQTVNIGTGTATAPVTGVYEFHGRCNSGQYYEIAVNGVTVGRTAGTQATGETSSLIFFANAGDTITCTTPSGAVYVSLQCFELKGLVNA